MQFQPTSERGFIGRLDSQKGYDLLLESLVEVLEEPIQLCSDQLTLVFFEILLPSYIGMKTNH